MTQTEQWTEEKLLAEVVTVLTPMIKKYVLGYIHNLNQLDEELRKQVDYLADQIHKLYKKYTYLKGDKELPEKEFVSPNENYRYNEAQQDMVNVGFKSTEGWKK